MEIVNTKKRIAILGSTGSIGTQALEVIANHPDEFEVEVLTAYNNAELLVKQAMQFIPNCVVIGNEAQYHFVKEALEHLPIKVFAGSQSIADVATMEPIDMVLTAMVGYSGLLPTIKAIEAGKHIALSNKETLVVAGDLITSLATKHKVGILPVDSEHSAIFQCLQGEYHNPVEKIILTASGGPFRNKSAQELLYVTPADALKHPNWCMGSKVTIDSASLMNKGLEVIEAKWLFGLEPSQIEVLVHPQSIIHSMVEFTDGSIKAQMGLPDMRLPIQYAFGFPKRLEADFPRLDFAIHHSLTFEKPDVKRFPNLLLAFEALKKGGNMPCILNAANEVAVDAFLKDQLAFSAMSELIERTMQKASFVNKPSYDDYVATDGEARKLAQALLNEKVINNN